MAENAIVQFATAALTADADDNKALAQALKDESKKHAGGRYISFSGKTGRYTIEDVQHSDRLPGFFLLDPSTFVTGVVCWKGGSRVDGILKPITDPTPVNYDSKKHAPFADGEGWFDAQGFVVAPINGDDHTPYAFTTNSTSGNRAFSVITKETSALIEEHDFEMVYPILKFDSASFEANTPEGKQKNYRPVIELCAYLTQEQVRELMADEGTSWRSFIRANATLVDGFTWPVAKKKKGGAVKKRTRAQ